MLERDGIGPLPRANSAVKVSALTPLLRPDAPGTRPCGRRRAGCARCCERPTTAAAPTCTSTWSRWTPARRVLELVLELLVAGRVPRRPVGGPGAAGLPARLAATSSIRSSPGRGARARRPPLDRAAGQGRLLGPRARPGPPARLDGAGVRVDKAECDRNFEALTRRLLDARPLVRVAIASHNLRSVAHAIAYNRFAGGASGPRAPGAARPGRRAPGTRLRHAGSGCGPTARSATSVAGMAYLVRRLLENTEQRQLPPARRPGRRDSMSCSRRRRRRAVSLVRPSPTSRSLELRAPPCATRCGPRSPSSTARCRSGAGDRRRATARDGGRELASTDPGRPTRLVARGRGRAVRRRRGGRGRGAARASAPGERFRPAIAPAALMRAAAWMRERRLELAALVVRECAKPWPEADADVCEAIDFLEYYARAAIDARARPRAAPGSRRAQRTPLRAPRGHSRDRPWNFPLAIACGMTPAALAAGNAVVLKPAEQSPAMRAPARRGAARRRRPARGDLAAARRGRRSARRSSAIPAFRRSRSPGSRRSASRSSRPPPRSSPASATSSG